MNIPKMYAHYNLELMLALSQSVPSPAIAPIEAARTLFGDFELYAKLACCCKEYNKIIQENCRKVFKVMSPQLYRDLAQKYPDLEGLAGNWLSIYVISQKLLPTRISFVQPTCIGLGDLPLLHPLSDGRVVVAGGEKGDIVTPLTGASAKIVTDGLIKSIAQVSQDNLLLKFVESSMDYLSSFHIPTAISTVKNKWSRRVDGLSYREDVVVSPNYTVAGLVAEITIISYGKTKHLENFQGGLRFHIEKLILCNDRYLAIQLFPDPWITIEECSELGRDTEKLKLKEMRIMDLLRETTSVFPGYCNIFPAFSQDTLFALRSDNTLDCVNSTTGQVEKSFELEHFDQVKRVIINVVGLPNGNLVTHENLNRTTVIRIWDLSNEKLLRECSFENLYSLCVLSDGQLAAISAKYDPDGYTLSILSPNINKLIAKAGLPRVQVRDVEDDGVAEPNAWDGFAFDEDEEDCAENLTREERKEDGR